jgi:disulfide bond formation protein DsbB
LGPVELTVRCRKVAWFSVEDHANRSSRDQTKLSDFGPESQGLRTVGLEHMSERASGPASVPLWETWGALARTRPIAAAAVVVAVVGIATILGAWFFQYAIGLKPCPLCYEQRYPYYFAIPLAALVILGDSVGSKRKVLIGALAMIALGMLWNTGLGVYHSGVEWKLWTGPRDCSGTLEGLGSATDLLNQLERVSVVRCDEAAWRFLGISLSGYNAMISLALAAVAGWGVAAGRRLAARDDVE